MHLKTRQFEHNFIPSKGTAGGKVLVLAHGRGGNLKLLEYYSKRFDIPELSYLTIQAPWPEQREDQVAKNEWGWSWWHWPDFKRLEESRHRLQRMVEELEEQGVASEKIFWLGFSQGAGIGLDLFLRSERCFGGGLFISGLLPRSTDYPKAFGSKAPNQNILITHGTRDEIISLQDAENTYLPLRQAQIPFDFKVYDKPHSFHLKEEVPFLENTLQGWIRS